MLMLAFPVIILAVHNLALLRVKLKTAFLQTLPDHFEHKLHLSPALGVDDQSSSLGEFHLHALAEPDGSLSTHPALIAQPIVRVVKIIGSARIKIINWSSSI
jgi:hypothetical protein